jgi:hypothetical protein
LVAGAAATIGTRHASTMSGPPPAMNPIPRTSSTRSIVDLRRSTMAPTDDRPAHGRANRRLRNRAEKAGNERHLLWAIAVDPIAGCVFGNAPDGLQECLPFASPPAMIQNG